MKISLKNIGKVKEANIEINGITIIAGENNTGKSTIGKTLFSVFNSFYDIENTIKTERKKILENKILQYLFSKDIAIESIDRISDMTKEITIELIEKSPMDIEQLNEYLLNKFKSKILNFDKEFQILEKNETDDFIKNIYEILTIENNYIFKIYFQRNLISEFNGQINNLYNNNIGEIELNISNKKIFTTIESQKIKEIKVDNDKMLSLYTRAVYIDDPFILDTPNRFYMNKLTHREYLISKLTSTKKEQNIVEDALFEKNIEIITEKLKNVFDGEIIFSSDNLKNKFKLKDSKEELDLRNLSTGLKTFAIIKTLLNNGTLEKNGTIILDEPEIHLHPEWQLIFAEIIVLLQKELNLHILLTTHSPYFLRAIQVYSGNYKIADKCKYYLAENEDNSSIIKDVSDKINLIFKKLSRPLQILEDLKYE